MFGTTGVHHPKTKAERATMMRLEARSHANECERLANGARIVGQDRMADALEKAAKFIRHFAGSDEVQV
jgi:hypothetical protein